MGLWRPQGAEFEDRRPPGWSPFRGPMADRGVWVAMVGRGALAAMANPGITEAMAGPPPRPWPRPQPPPRSLQLQPFHKVEADLVWRLRGTGTWGHSGCADT